jgi:hypothetical protein
VRSYGKTNSELSMSDPTGVSWTAKFDGKDYAVKVTSAIDSVALRKVDSRTVELSLKASGAVVRVNTMTISADGKTMTTVSQSKLSGRTATFRPSKSN